ncbi:hypothetical protein EYC58_00175 [Candidatus Saccharibacteria bacterium]|nr:MAG: hypothetical protein EYC58_00175 [Candidatus Saccharibacteria bacterium]
MEHGYYHVHEWTPALKQTGDELVAKIQGVAPELEVLFMGAAALGLPGKNDIDLDILCSTDDIKHYTSILESVLGTPHSLSDEMAVWSYVQDGVEIDCILSDPARPDSHVPKQKKVFEKLKTNPELREQYRKLKYECDGLPYEQYEAQKKAFLQEVEAL